MISRIYRALTKTQYVYSNPLEQRRANGLLVMNWALVLAWAIWVFGVTLPELTTGQTIETEVAVWLVVAPMLTYTIYRLTQTGRLAAASWLLIGLILVGVLPTIWQGINGTVAVILALPLIAAGILLNWRGLLIVSAILLLSITVGATTQSQTIGFVRYRPADVVEDDLLLVGLTLGVGLAFLLVLGGNIERVVADIIATRGRIQRAAEFGIQVEQNTHEEQILTQTSRFLRDQLDYTHARIYRLNEDGSLEESAAALSTAYVLLEAARLRQTVLITPDDIVSYLRHLLPPARFAAVIPLVHQDTVIGVLDVQSVDERLFSEENRAALEVLAGHVATALAHARRVNELQHTQHQQEEQIAGLQTQLHELQQRYGLAAGRDWAAYLEGRGKQVLGFDLLADSASLVPAHDLPEPLRVTLEKGELYVETVGDEQIVNVPIVLRDQTLGVMSFALPKDQTLTERRIEMAQVVSERLALALDNMRLLEQTQALALRERKASEVTNALIGATDVNAVLDLAAESFNEALGAIHTRIYLQPQAWTETPSQAESEKAVP